MEEDRPLSEEESSNFQNAIAHLRTVNPKPDFVSYYALPFSIHGYQPYLVRNFLTEYNGWNQARIEQEEEERRERERRIARRRERNAEMLRVMEEHAKHRH